MEPELLIIALDSQRMGSLESCLRRFNLRFNLNLDKADNSEGIEKGTLIHELLRYYYLGKMIGDYTLDDDSKVISLDSDAKLTPYQLRDKAIPFARRKIPELNLSQEAIIDVVSTFNEYVDVYSAETWEIIGVESPFSVILYQDQIERTVAGQTYSGLVILWEGIIDLEVERGIDKFPVDHKSGSRRTYPDPLDIQFMGYAYKTESTMVCVNQIEFKKDKDKFHRPFLVYEDFLIDEFVESVIFAVENRYIPALNTDKWGPNFKSCNQKFSCVFTDFCKADKTTKAHLLQTKYKVVKPWDPFSRDE